MPRTRAKTDLIQHRYALTADDAFVNIDDYTPGATVRCIGCRREMVGRQGKRKQWHFAHKADPVDTCSVETVLHRLGKAFIKEGFGLAVAEQRPFEMRWPCPRCTTSATQDCTKIFDRIEIEGRPTSGVQSDVLFHGKCMCAVEIVVTHDLEPETTKLYAQAGVPVFIVRPTWDTIHGLRTEIVAESLRFATNKDCPGCATLDDLATRQDIAAFLERMRLEVETKPRWALTVHPTRRWWKRCDQNGRDIDEATQGVILGHASALGKFGFCAIGRQLVLCRHLPGVGNLLAHFRGTPELSVCDDPRPFFCLELHTLIAGDAARVLIRERLRASLEHLGIPVRDVYVTPERDQAQYLLHGY